MISAQPLSDYPKFCGERRCDGLVWISAGRAPRIAIWLYFRRQAGVRALNPLIVFQI
jgi:hypothetical protein